MTEITTIPYLGRDAWLQAIQRVEDDYTLPDGRMLRIRELSAEERIAAQEIGDADPETHFYTNLGGMYAYIMVCGVIDPETHAPLFTADDIPTLIGTRGGATRAGLDIRSIGSAIWRLSEADQDSFRGLGDPADEPGDAHPVDGAPDSDGATAAE